MADIFKFGAFLKGVNKKREESAEQAAPAKQDSTESQPSMSQSDFLYGTEGLRRKEKKQ